MNRQGWKRDRLTDPVIVYQLALRMGSSYSATCYALQECKGIDRATCEKLLAVKPKAIKQKLAKPYEPDSWYGDVWLVTERDNGMVLEEAVPTWSWFGYLKHANSGVRLEFRRVGGRRAGDSARRSHRQDTPPNTSAGSCSENDHCRGHWAGASGHVKLREVRPWQPKGEPLNSMELEVQLFGPMGGRVAPRTTRRGPAGGSHEFDQGHPRPPRAVRTGS